MTKPRGTGSPDLSKDRTAHNARRGVKIAGPKTLKHLTKKPLNTEEFNAALDSLKTESDRGAAIVGAALVEDALIAALDAWLENSENRDALYYDVGAPFGTLRAKTVAVYGLGICSKELRDQIDVIRSIRNEFSHTLRPLDFKHPDVVALCSRLPKPKDTDPDIFPLREKEMGPARMRFFAACLRASVTLLRTANERLEQDLARYRAEVAGLKDGPQDVSG